MRFNEIAGRYGYQAFELDAASRSALAREFPPKFPEFIGHHITHKFGVSADEPLPEAKDFKVVGYGCNPEGIEALVVAVDGTTERPDGNVYHCTWSLDRDAGFKPVKSNNLLAGGYERLAVPINIHAVPKFF